MGDVADSLDSQEQAERADLGKGICKLRQQKVSFTALKSASEVDNTAEYSDKHVKEFWARAKLGKDWVGGKGRLCTILVSADMFTLNNNSFGVQAPSDVRQCIRAFVGNHSRAKVSL